jgi:hypothetical protein
VTGEAGVLVQTPETERFGHVLAAPGVTVVNDGTDRMRVSGVTAEQIGAVAWRVFPDQCLADAGTIWRPLGEVIHELAVKSQLEQANSLV